MKLIETVDKCGCMHWTLVPEKELKKCLEVLNAHEFVVSTHLLPLSELKELQTRLDVELKQTLDKKP